MASILEIIGSGWMDVPSLRGGWASEAFEVAMAEVLSFSCTLQHASRSRTMKRLAGSFVIDDATCPMLHNNLRLLL